MDAGTREIGWVMESRVINQPLCEFKSIGIQFSQGAVDVDWPGKEKWDPYTIIG